MTDANLEAFGLPIRIAGIFVSPGDLVAGDGVVVLPRDRVADILAKAEAREEKEAGIIRQLAEGRTTMERYG